MKIITPGWNLSWFRVKCIPMYLIYLTEWHHKYILNIPGVTITVVTSTTGLCCRKTEGPVCVTIDDTGKLAHWCTSKRSNIGTPCGFEVGHTSFQTKFRDKNSDINPYN